MNIYGICTVYAGGYIIVYIYMYIRVVCMYRWGESCNSNIAVLLQVGHRTVLFRDGGRGRR